MLCYVDLKRLEITVCWHSGLLLLATDLILQLCDFFLKLSGNLSLLNPHGVINMKLHFKCVWHSLLVNKILSLNAMEVIDQESRKLGAQLLVSINFAVEEPV